MTSLQQTIDRSNSQIQELANQAKLIEQQLRDLQHQIKIMGVKTELQTNTQNQFKDILSSFRTLARNACSCLEKKDLDLFLIDLTQIVEEAKANYDEYHQSDRILNQQTQEIEDEEVSESTALPQPDASHYTVLVEASTDLPEPDNDTYLLSSDQVEQVIKDCPETTLNRLKGLLNLNSRLRNLTSIAKAISQKQITHQKLLDLIELINSQSLLLAGFNGKRKT